MRKKRHTKELLNLRVNEKKNFDTLPYAFALMLNFMKLNDRQTLTRDSERDAAGCVSTRDESHRKWLEFPFQQANIVLNKHHSNNNV